MPYQTNLYYLINQPVGVSFIDGTGTSGILCNVNSREIYLLEYLYHNQFAMKHYPLAMIQGVYPFPDCKTYFKPPTFQMGGSKISLHKF